MEENLKSEITEILKSKGYNVRWYNESDNHKYAYNIDCFEVDDMCSPIRVMSAYNIVKKILKYLMDKNTICFHMEIYRLTVEDGEWYQLYYDFE